MRCLFSVAVDQHSVFGGYWFSGYSILLLKVGAMFVNVATTQ